MPDEKTEPREWNLRQMMPWTELFRAFSIALDIKKLLLAAAAIVVMTLGWWILAMTFSRGPEPRLADLQYKDPEVKQKEFRKRHLNWSAIEQFKEWPWFVDRGPNPFRLRRQELVSANYWSDQVMVLLEPLVKFAKPVYLLLHPSAGLRVRVFCILGILWTLATWAVFGGAITRIAAVQIARKEKIGLVDSVKFAVSKFVSFFSAPVFPFLGIVFILLLLFIGSSFLMLWWVGDVLVGLLWVLALGGGFVMAIILLGFAGWPLMYATISAEGSDSFDALSRSYSYVFQRPWSFAWYVLVSIAYGLVVIFFVVCVTSSFVYLARWGAALNPLPAMVRGIDDGEKTGPVSALFIWAPRSYEWRDLLLGTETPEELETKADALRGQMDWPTKGAAVFVAFWLYLIFLLMVGFAYSYFWSAATLIYFLLRKKVDDTDLDEVYLEEEEEESYTLPPTPAPATTGAPTGPTTLPMTEPPPGGETGPPT